MCLLSSVLPINMHTPHHTHTPRHPQLLRTPKYSRKSVPKTNPLDSYAILKYPLTPESATVQWRFVSSVVEPTYQVSAGEPLVAERDTRRLT